jgi:NADP-dependent 3-hydroxy acid dehydrogenase YdfG
MTQIANKTAHVTGAASGIGYALTKSLLARGCKVMMSDIDGDKLAKARAELGEENTAMVVCDVADAAAVQAAAKATADAFGNVHLLFNNAGVSLAGLPGKFDLRDWQWITDINLLGVAYGVEAFLPLLTAHDEGGHIVNTASMAGHASMAGMAPYHATKFAVVGYSEALKLEVERAGIGVSCLCPTWVQSNIHNTSDASPGAIDGADIGRAKYKQSKAYNIVKALIENGMSADMYSELCMKGIEAGRMHIFNDPEMREALIARHNSNLAEFDANLADLKTLQAGGA